jgi:hypothetical protein
LEIMMPPELGPGAVALLDGPHPLPGSPLCGGAPRPWSERHAGGCSVKTFFKKSLDGYPQVLIENTDEIPRSDDSHLHLIQNGLLPHLGRTISCRHAQQLKNVKGCCSIRSGLPPTPSALLQLHGPLLIRVHVFVAGMKLRARAGRNG